MHEYSRLMAKIRTGGNIRENSPDQVEDHQSNKRVDNPMISTHSGEFSPE